VVVPVAFVLCVTVPIVNVVRVVAVRDRNVPAARAVLVGMVGVERVTAGLALVEMVLMEAVQVAVVDVVDMVAVRDRDVAAACAVFVEVAGVLGVDRGGHSVTHLSCR
jgi:hypothetical protein